MEDQAQKLEAREWALNNTRLPMPKYEPEDDGYGPEKCVECDGDMPAVRRAMGSNLCTECKSLTEKPNHRR